MNKLMKVITSLSIVLVMIIGLSNSTMALKEYKISFKAGSKGLYSDGSTSVNQMVVAGNDLATAPDTLVASLVIEPGYYFNGWNYTVVLTGIEKSANYVAQYKRIIDEAVYRVRYVDNYGNELATQKVVTSNVGVVIAENAINIDGYAVDTLTKTATVEKEGTEIVFTYVSLQSGDVETIIQNEVVVLAGGTAGIGTGTSTVGTGTAGDVTEVTPGNQAGGTGGLGTEELPENQTPLAGNKDKTTSSDNTGLIIGIIGAVVIASAVIFFIKKKRTV